MIIVETAYKNAADCSVSVKITPPLSISNQQIGPLSNGLSLSILFSAHGCEVHPPFCYCDDLFHVNFAHADGRPLSCNDCTVVPLYTRKKNSAN